MTTVTQEDIWYQRANCILDQAAEEPVQGDTADVSLIAHGPSIVMAEGSSLSDYDLEVKNHKDASWQKYADLSGTAYKVEFAVPYNFVRLRRTTGSVEIKAWAQFAGG